MDASRRFWEIPVSKAQLKGHTLELREEDLTFAPANGIEQALIEKLNAEMARLVRLAGDAPAGYRWEYEQQRLDEPFNNVYKFRVVARLVPNV